MSLSNPLLVLVLLAVLLQPVVLVAKIDERTVAMRVRGLEIDLLNHVRGKAEEHDADATKGACRGRVCPGRGKTRRSGPRRADPELQKSAISLL